MTKSIKTAIKKEDAVIMPNNGTNIDDNMFDIIEIWSIKMVP